MTFAETVYDALPKSGGITYLALIATLDRSKSQISTALRELEAVGKAKRERVPAPTVYQRGRMDLSRSPKVLWRRV